MNKRLSITILTVVLFVVMATSVYAQGIVPSGCQGTNCQVSDFVVTAVKVSEWILKVSGSFALLFFVYGGFLWVTAAGNASKVEQGRNVLTGTVIAIVIILGAFTAVDFIGDALGVKESVFNQYLQN